MVEADGALSNPAGLDLMADITCAEPGGREADQSIQHDEDDIDFVDDQIGAGTIANAKQIETGKKGQERGEHIQSRCQPVARQDG